MGFVAKEKLTFTFNVVKHKKYALEVIIIN